MGALALVVALVAAPATAAARGGGDAGAGSDGDIATVDAIYTAPMGSVVRAGTANGSGPRWACGWYDVHFGVVNPGSSNVSPEPVAPVEGHVYLFACWEGSRPATVDWAEPGTVYQRAATHEAGEPAPDPGPPSPGDIAQAIVDSGMVDPQPPTIELNPVGVQVVHVDTWIHVADDWHHEPVSAHAGPIEATVAVEPDGLWFDPGDGAEPVLCPTRGTAYDRDVSLDEQSTDCSYTYRRSRSEPYPATATVRWSVSWTSNTGAGGALVDIVETTPVPVTVRQLQPVIE